MVHRYLRKLVLYIVTIVTIVSTTHRIHGAAIYGNMDPFNIPHFC